MKGKEKNMENELERRVDALERKDIEKQAQIDAIKQELKANGEADAKRWQKTVHFVKTGSKVMTIGFVVLLVLIGMFPALADRLLEVVPILV